jgi:hypothetical protein
MSFQASLDAALRDTLRPAAASRMTSTCTVRRKTGASTIVNGQKVPTWTAVHTDLPCRIGGANTGSAGFRTLSADIGGGVSVPARVASLPHDTTDLRDGDLLEVTSGETEGLVFRLLEVDAQDQATALRVPVVGAARPMEWT